MKNENKEKKDDNFTQSFLLEEFVELMAVKRIDKLDSF